MTKSEYIARHGIPITWDGIDLTDPPPRMTYRQAMAMHTMLVILQHHDPIKIQTDIKDLLIKDIAIVSLACADALIAAEEKTNGK